MSTVNEKQGTVQTKASLKHSPSRLDSVDEYVGLNPCSVYVTAGFAQNASVGSVHEGLTSLLDYIRVQSNFSPQNPIGQYPWFFNFLDDIRNYGVPKPGPFCRTYVDVSGSWSPMSVDDFINSVVPFLKGIAPDD
jgi:hypothetical protein